MCGAAVPPRALLLLTLGLRDVACVNAERNITLRQMSLRRNLILRIQLVQHFYSAIFHNLLRAEGGEAEFKEVRLIGYSLNNVLALVVIVECFSAEGVPGNRKRGVSIEVINLLPNSLCSLTSSSIF